MQIEIATENQFWRAMKVGSPHDPLQKSRRDKNWSRFMSIGLSHRYTMLSIAYTINVVKAILA
jgi:hypothetical protein